MNPWGSKQKGGFVALLHIPITCYLLHTYRRGGRAFSLIKNSCLGRNLSNIDSLSLIERFNIPKIDLIHLIVNNLNYSNSSELV